MYQFMDLFALPEMTLYANVIEVIYHLLHSDAFASYIEMFNLTYPFKWLLLDFVNAAYLDIEME